MFKHKFYGLFYDMPAADGGAGGMGGGSGEGDPIREAIVSSMGEGGEGNEPPAPAQKTAEEEAEEAELAGIEKEIREKNPAMRGNIAIHRHQAVLTRTRNQHQKALEEWTAKEKAWQEREAAIAKQEAEWKQYEWAKDAEIQQALRAIALSEEDPEKFVELLLQDERYAKMLQRAGQQPAVPADRPGPNQKTAEGLEYYDDEGLTNLLTWHGSTLEKTLSEKLTKQIADQMEQKYGKVATAFEQSTRWADAKQRAEVDLQRYRKEWPGYAQHEKDIKALMMAPGNERMGIEEAYIRTVPQKFQEAGKIEKDKLRAEIIAEMKAKPAAAQAVVKSSGVERSGEPKDEDRDIADVIRDSIKNLPR
jgi:hypothetical protein